MQRIETVPAVRVVDVPESLFLQIDGAGGPSSSTFQRALDALTDTAHTLRNGGPIEPLEALWWWGDPNGPPPPDDREWMWTLMIRQPETVTQKRLRDAILSLRERHGPVLDGLRIARMREGRCLEATHVGPYSRELPTLDVLHREMRRMGYVPAGKHHEIYLDDPTRTPPEKLRTLVRQPVRWTDETQA